MLLIGDRFDDRRWTLTGYSSYADTEVKVHPLPDEIWLIRSGNGLIAIATTFEAMCTFRQTKDWAMWGCTVKSMRRPR